MSSWHIRVTSVCLSFFLPGLQHQVQDCCLAGCRALGEAVGKAPEEIQPPCECRGPSARLCAQSPSHPGPPAAALPTPGPETKRLAGRLPSGPASLAGCDWNRFSRDGREGAAPPQPCGRSGTNTLLPRVKLGSPGRSHRWGNLAGEHSVVPGEPQVRLQVIHRMPSTSELQINDPSFLSVRISRAILGTYL